MSRCKVSLAHLYNWQGEHFGQTIWDKTEVLLRTSWETYLGTWWEHDGNTLGRREKNKIPLSPHLSPPPYVHKKKTGLFVSAEPSHWLHEISLSKTVHHHRSPGLIPIPKSWGTFPSFTSPIHLSYSLDEVPPKFNFVGLAYQGKGIVFRFNIEYNSLRYFLM
jgi:hypothetical protein